MQQLALLRLITVAIKQEAGEDPCCPGHHHPCLQDNEGRRHFDKAPFSQAPPARPSCTKQCHCVRGDHLGGQEPQYSPSSLCVLSSPGSASTHCLHRGWGEGHISLKAWTPFKVGEKDKRQWENKTWLHSTYRGGDEIKDNVCQTQHERDLGQG